MKHSYTKCEIKPQCYELALYTCVICKKSACYNHSTEVETAPGVFEFRCCCCNHEHEVEKDERTA